MIKPKTKLEKRHWHHHMQIKKCSHGPHYAALICTDCNKIMRWLNRLQVKQIRPNKYTSEAERT